jgi:protein TonB
VRSMLDSNKKYPLLSLQRRQEGTPVVEFTILGNGDVIDVKITSSGYRLLDREAQRIILKSAPFPPIPKSLGKNRIDLRVPINFSLQR